MSTSPARVVPLVLLATACAPTSPPLTDAEREAVAEEIRVVLGTLTEAMNAHDPEGVIAYYPEDPDFLYLGCTEFITGGQTFRRMVAPFYGPDRGVSFEQQIVSIQVLSPSSAVVSQRGSSSDVDALFWTQVLEKREGRWVITYEHESWPGCDPPTAPHPYTAPGDSSGLLPGGVSR